MNIPFPSREQVEFTRCCYPPSTRIVLSGMQKSNNEVVESVLMAIPADLLEEVGIDLYSTIQMSVSRGRIIIEPVDEEESAFHQTILGAAAAAAFLSLAHVAQQLDHEADAQLCYGLCSVAGGVADSNSPRLCL